MSSAVLCSLAAVISVQTPASALHALESDSRDPRVEAVEALSFRDFVAKFNRSYSEGTSQWAEKEAVFAERKKEVLTFLRGPPQSWTMDLTQFADYSASEYQAILGYKGRRRSASTEERAALARERKFTHPQNYSVMRDNRELGDIVRDQGACGSCWAEAATAALESQMEANRSMMKGLRRILDTQGKVSQAPTLSSQAMVSCTKNPRNCGGTGGCSGATVELAYDMVKEYGGLPMAIEWAYESGFGATPECRESVFQEVAIGITGYEVLPSNKVRPLMQALFQTGGAIAVSADASHWGMYSGGIFSDSTFGGDFTVNHAVTLMAYKRPTRDASGELDMGYWLIKNSWGKSWGEGGFIRLEMKENEELHCGMDKDTHKGLACDGDPDEAWVCGTCGVLYDSVYPTGVHLLKPVPAYVYHPPA
jgi:cathepsin L